MSRHPKKNGLQRLWSGPDPTTLILGDIHRWKASGRLADSNAEYVFANFEDLNQELLATVNPHMILSPLIADKFDASDVIAKLNQFRFSGPYRAISGPLPDPGLVRAELQRPAPFLDFDIIVMPPHGR